MVKFADSLARSHRYDSDSRLAGALAFLRRPDLSTLADGRYDIDGDAVYAMVQRYTTKLPEHGRWEAHQRYADIQLVVQGTERIGCGDMAAFKRGDYDAVKDVEFLSGEGLFLHLAAGDFVVLQPGEVHMPGIAAGEPERVMKVVVKVRMDAQPDGKC